MGQPLKVGFHINRIYSLLGRSGDLSKLVKDWIAVNKSGDNKKLQGFINSTLAEPWEEIFTEKLDPDNVKTKHRLDWLPPQVVPETAICLTMGIDTQAAGYWWVARAWDADKTSYLADYGFSPSLEELEYVVFERSYPVEETGRQMSVWRAAIDSGGTRLEGGISMTERVYEWVRKRGRGRVHCVKGMSQGSQKVFRVKQTIIDRMPSRPGRKGRVIPGGLVLYHINTEEFKDTLHWRLSLAPEESGAFFVHKETGKDYFDQLLSEYKRRHVRTGKVEWVKKAGVENHLLDAEVYCAATVDDEWQGGIRLLRRAQASQANQRPRGVISRGVKV